MEAFEMTNDELNNLLEATAGVLIRCLVLSVVVLLIWFFFAVAAADWAYSIHSRWFRIDRSSFDTIWYCGMGIVKLIAFMFFLFPYVSIKLVLKKRR
jgi:hypothetical protein